MPAATSLATATDVDAVAALLRATTLHYWGLAPPLKEYRPVAARLLDPEGDCELATVDGQAVGFASFAVVYPGPAATGLRYMKELFVLEAVRGRGIGEELLRFLAGIAWRAAAPAWTGPPRPATRRDAVLRAARSQPRPRQGLLPARGRGAGGAHAKRMMQAVPASRQYLVTSSGWSTEACLAQGHPSRQISRQAIATSSPVQVGLSHAAAPQIGAANDIAHLGPQLWRRPEVDAVPPMMSALAQRRAVRRSPCSWDVVAFGPS